MPRPLLYDLFCGAGGAGMGYHRAGFRVIGIDHKAQPHYPFEFIKMDALEFLAKLATGEFEKPAAIHASPPCQRWCVGCYHKLQYLDLLTPTRAACGALGLPYVLENVPKAPLRPDIVLCGDFVKLPLIKRQRHFETNWFHNLQEIVRMERRGPVITVTGHGTTTGNRASWGRNIRTEEMRRAMGIEWMNRDELSQAIPPAYTEYIGKLLYQAIMEAER